MKKVAITGGLSSGKTTVCEILKKKGAYIVSADDIVHQLLSPQSSIGQQIIDLLGEDIVKGTEFNRRIIADKVFKDKKTLKSLENILHPAVLEEIDKHFNEVRNQNPSALFVAEIPLLYEIECEHLFDASIAVITDPSIAQNRFQEKTKNPTEEFEMRMTHQLPLVEKKARADYIITNNGSYLELESQVETLYKNLTQQE